MNEEAIKYPQIYKHENGETIIAQSEIQGAAFEKAGFTPDGEYVDKKGK